MIYILSRVKRLAASPENLIYIAFVSVFLHYVITGIVIAFIGVSALLQKESRQQVFSFKGKNIFVLFIVYTIFQFLTFYF